MKRIEQNKVDKMMAMHSLGSSAVSIAESLCVSSDSVRYYLRRAGYQLPGRGRTKLITADVARAAVKLRMRGICWKLVSRMLGFNANCLMREIRALRAVDKIEERV